VLLQKQMRAADPPWCSGFLSAVEFLPLHPPLFFGHVPIGDSDSHIGYIAHLRCQVTCHLIHGVCRSFQVPATPGTFA
jgi:hypothetical protein